MSGASRSFAYGGNCDGVWIELDLRYGTGIGLACSDRQQDARIASLTHVGVASWPTSRGGIAVVTSEPRPPASPFWRIVPMLSAAPVGAESSEGLEVAVHRMFVGSLVHESFRCDASSLRRPYMSLLDVADEPALRIRLRRGFTVGASADRTMLCLKNADNPFVSTPLCRHVDAYDTASELLVDGAPLSALRGSVLAAGGGAAASESFLILLQRLCRWGYIEYLLTDDAAVRAIIEPQSESFTPTLAPAVPDRKAALDPCALIRRDGDVWLLESPLVGARFRITALADLEAPVVRRALGAAGFLQDPEELPDERRTALKQWEFHDLIFAFHHRRGWHRDPFGAQFPYVGEIDPLPAARPPWTGRPIALRRASDRTGGESFASVLERRKSVRSYDEARPITLDQFGALLDRAARMRSCRTVPVGNLPGKTTEFEQSRRPYPNGGASYELEIYPVVEHCDGLEKGVYHYDAAGHALVLLNDETAAVDTFVSKAKGATAGQADPQMVLVIAARFARVMWKYRSMAYSLILCNLGALYQTLYLAATELEISPCGLGSTDAALFARATGLDPVVEGSVGEFILGGRPRS